jgi:hypothetical protein
VLTAIKTPRRQFPYYFYGYFAVFSTRKGSAMNFEITKSNPLVQDIANGKLFQCLSVFFSAVACSAALLGGAATAGAAPLAVTSYDMTNGGTSSLGTSLRDDTYTGGTGNPGVNYSILTGGIGELTNGITNGGNWNTTPGPYVGWQQSALASPIITFHFGAMENFNDVHIYTNWQYSASSVDFSVNGGSTWINRAVNLLAPSTANVWVDFLGLGLTGNTLTLRLNDRANNSYPDQVVRSADWIMIQEVTFDGSPAAAIPEPKSYAFLLAGLGLLWLGKRRQQQQDT